MFLCRFDFGGVNLSRRISIDFGSANLSHWVQLIYLKCSSYLLQLRWDICISISMIVWYSDTI